MPLTSKIRARYQRRVGFPGYSHIEIEVEEEVVMEEGDTPEDVERDGLARMGKAVYAEMAPVVELYRQGNDLPADPDEKKAAKKKAKKPKEPATHQAGLPEPTEPLPEAHDDGERPEPEYNDDGDRMRSKPKGQHLFKVGEINVAWKLLYDKKIVDTEPDTSKEVNQERQQIRAWLKMSPLDPGFIEVELEAVVESYGKWKAQGLTTQESMAEVGHDYIGRFFRDEPGKGSDDSDTGGGDKEAESGEEKAEPVDQEPGDPIAGPDPNGQHGSDNEGDGGDPEAPEAPEAE